MSDKVYITLDQYWMGRNITHKKELTDEIIKNAEYTVECTNKLLNMAADDGVVISNQKVNSGWRPKSINDKTPGASKISSHVTSEGIDLGEYSDQRLRKWINANPSKVKAAGFEAIEEFSYTITWVHLQTRAKLPIERGRIMWAPVNNGWKNFLSNSVKNSLL